MVSRGVFVLVSVLAITSAVPVYNGASTQCSITCPETTNSKFSYERGKTYQYDYESDIKTSVSGTSAEHSSLHMRASVFIDVLLTCEMQLRLTDVSLQDSDPARNNNKQPVRDLATFRRALQDKPLTFSLVDGRVEAVCTQSDEEPWAANIKRGIISSLQNTMPVLQGVTNTRETDVSGDCPVKYQVTSTSGWSHVVSVRKTKDLLSCTDRQSTQTVFQGIPYKAESDIQSSPLMKSTYSCDQEIDTRSRLLTKSSCAETHAFRPFAKSDSGAVTEVSYKLTFKQQTDTRNPPTIDRSRRVLSSLLFDHTPSAAQMADTLRESQQTLTEICRQIQVDVRPQTPGLFSNLVRQMKRLDARNLRQLHSLSRNTMCTKAEQLVRDALPVLGTTASVALMRELISSNRVTDIEKDVWLTSLAFIKTPTREMLVELKSLLSDKFLESSLPVSSVVNTYCSQYDNQQTSAEVQQIVKVFEDELRYNCRSDSEQQTTRMMTALRALGNAGLAASTVTSTLDRCAMNDDIPTAVRVAAINAFRRIECTPNNRENMLRLLEKREADSELRINAYLAAMKCVDDQTLQRVQTILESEEINQVGSFIWTHLTNLQETSSPLKSQIRVIIENVELQKQFDVDKRKFSRNIELSSFSDLLNVGANLESNLIWSTNSFVPRSAMVNLTVDMFGQSVNLLEVGGRVQGIEDLLEKLFGPEKEMDNILSREKRALIRDDVLNTIDRKFDKKVDSDQLSYYLRIFGNDVRAGDFYSFDLDSIKSRFNFLDWLIELAKEHSIDVTRNFHFLDASLAIPTGTGMPVRLSAEGTATVGLTLKGKVDIRQMLSSPSTFDISGSVKPSAAIEVRGEMGIDAFVAKTGLKVVNVMHTSTVLDGALQLRNGKVFNFDFNVPQDKLEIFSAESQLFVTYRDQEREQKKAPAETWQWKKCSGQTITDKTGMQLCAEMSLPAGKEKMILPMIGPAVAKIYLNKLDTYRGLHFDASYTENDGSDVVRVSFNMPGSRVDRELTTVFTLDRTQQQVRLDVKTPWKKLNVEGGLVNRADLKQATLKAVIDDTTQYSIVAEVQIDESSRPSRYLPKLEIQIPNRPNIVFDGTVAYTKGVKAEVRVALKNAFTDPVTFEGAVQVRERNKAVKYDVQVQIGSPIFKGTFTGYSTNARDDSSKSWASRAELAYQYRGGRKERIVVNHKIRDQSTNNLKTYSMDGSWQSTVLPSYNGQAGVELSYSPNSIRTKIEAGLDDVRKVSIITSAAYDVTGRDKKINGLFKFTVPYKDWNYEMKLDHINNWESLQSNATVKYGSIQQQQMASVDIGLKKESSRPLSVIGEARLKYPGREMSITETLTERAPREYYNVLNVQVQRGQTASVVSTYKMLQRHEMTNEITLPNRQIIRINGHLQPNLRNMQARVEVLYQGKTYLVDASWVHRGTINAFNTRGNAELNYAGYTAGLSTEISRRDSEFTGSLEAKLNQDKRIAISGQVTASLLTPRFLTKIEWPENFLQIEGSGKYEHRGWYATTNDLEGNLKMTSSLPGMNDLGMKFVHDQNANSFKTSGEMWLSTKKISGELSADRTKATLTLSTPFVGYRTIRAETTYSSRGLSGAFTGKVQWEGRQMELVLNGDVNQPSRQITGRMQFTSPFSGFEQLSANFRHTGNGQTYQTIADASWARGAQVTLTINMNHQASGYTLSNRGDISITTPFNGYRSGKLSWQHENTADTWKCHHELEVESRKFVLDLDASSRLSRTARQVVVRASFNCPPRMADWLQDLTINIDYQHDLRAWRSTCKSNLKWGMRHTFTYEHDVNIDPNSAIVIKTKVTTPFPGYEEIGIGLNNRRNGNSWTANNELMMGRNSKATLDGTLNYNGYNFDGMIRLTTPMRQLQRVVANLRNSQQNDGVWASHIDFQYGPDKTMSFDTKLGWERRRVIEFEASTPCPYLRQMKFAAGCAGNIRNFQASTELQHNMLGRDKFVASLSSNTLNLRNMNAMLTIRTPLPEFSSFKVEAKHLRDTDEHMLSTASWELNQYKGSALHDANVRSWVDFDERYELEYINGRKIELQTSLRIEPKIVARASFRSPFDVARSITFAFNQEGPLDNFKISSEVAYNRVKKVTTNMEFALTENSLRTFFRMTTPFPAVDRLAMTINLNGRPVQFNLDSSFELNTQKITKTLDFQLGRQTLRVNGKVETPFNVLRTLTYTINHNGDWRDFTNSMTMNYDQKEIRASSEFKASGPSGKFELRTPYRQLSSVTVNFNHVTNPGRQFAGWSNSASLEFNGQQYSGRSEWRGTVAEFTVTASVTLPNRDQYSAELTHRGNVGQFASQLKVTAPATVITVILNHRGNPSDLSSDITLTYNSHRINSAVTFKNNRRTTEGSLSLQTTFRGFENFRSSFSFTGTQQDFVTSASLELPFRGYERFSGELTHSGNARTFQTSGKLETSINEIRSVTFRIDHNSADITQIRTTFQMTTPSGQISSTFTHNGDAANFRTNLNVQTQISTLNENPSFTIGIEHQTGINSIKTAITVQTSYAGYENFGLSISKNGELRNLQLGAELTTPIRRLEKTTISWSHKIPDSNNVEFKASIETSVPRYERQAVSASHSTSRRGIRTTALVETSVRGFTKFGATSEYTVARGGWKWTGTAETSVRGYERWNAAIENGPSDNGDGFKTIVQLTTPIRGYNSFGATVSHSGGPAQFQTSVTVNTPFPQAPQIDIRLNHRGSTPTDFATGLSVDYADKKMSAEAAFKMGPVSRDEYNYDGSFKITTPYSIFSDFAVTASHNRKPDIKSGALTVTLNSEKKVDFDYSYTTSGDRNININIRSPYPMATELNVAGTGQGRAVINWDTTSDARKVQFDFGLKNVQTSSLTDRAINFKTVVAQRTVGFSLGYTLTSNKFTSHGELLWDRDLEHDFMYDIEAGQTSRRGLLSYDGRFRMSSYLFNTDSTFSHKITGGRRHITELVLDMANKLTIKSDLNMASSSGFSHTLTFQHPRLTRDVTVTTDRTSDGFKTTLAYDRQTWTLEGTHTDTSGRSSLKHAGFLRLSSPNNFVDIQLQGDLSSDYEAVTSALAFKYLTTRDRQLKTFAIRHELSKQRKEFKLELETPIDTMKFSTSNRELNIANGIVRYDVAMECSRCNVRSTVDFSLPDRSLNLKFYSTPDSFVEFFGQLLSPTQMTFEMSHTSQQSQVKDVSLTMSFDDNERIVTGRAYVRPDISDLATVLRPNNRMSALMQRDWSQFQTVMQEDGRYKMQYLQQAVVSPLSAVADYLSSQADIKQQQISTAFNAMYRANEFYIRDIHQALKRHSDDISRRMQYKMVEWQRTYAIWSANMEQQMNEVREFVQRNNEVVSQYMSRWWQSVVETMQPSFDRMRRSFDSAGETIRNKMEELNSRVRNDPKLREWAAKMASMKASDFFLSPSQLQSRLMSYGDRVDQWIQQLTDKPEMRLVHNWLVKTIQSSKWMYEFLGLEQQFDEMVAELRTMTWDKVKNKVRETLNTYLKLDKARYVWDTQRGEYSFQLYLPFDLPDMSLIQRFNPSPYISQFKDWVIRQLPTDDVTLIDMIYMYKPPSDVRDWVPPFKSHAVLSGAQHYMTFDRRFYEFAGECSYLLARDFIGGTFSVLVNYDRVVRGQPVKKSITVITGGRQIEVFPDGKVTIDASRVEMPARVANTTVMRSGNLVRVVDDRGVDVTCDLPHDHCTVAVSGWYYGKTAGLFGTYDNEPSNDMMTIDKTVATLPEQMADGWTVGSRCRSANRAVTVRPDPDTRRYKACSELFDNNTSMFRSCHRIVDPAPFMTICLNDVPTNDNSLDAETDICRAAASYVHECRRKEVQLRMPKQCVRCEVPDTGKVFYEMETIKLEQPADIPRAADVVFVIEHAPCNRDVLGKILGLVDNLEKAMQSEGITSTRFAVVGFGGKQGHLGKPHVHTMDGQIFNTADKLTLAINNFDLEPGTESDELFALQIAAQLPFRAGASKTVVLAGCDACQETETRYSDVQRILLGADVHLHVLVQDLIRLKSKSPKTAYIYGVDEQTVYTRKDVADDDLTGEPDLRRYIRLPKDLCVALTQDTDGSVFSVRQWLDSRPVTQKQFVDVLVRILARKGQPTECQFCQCTTDAAQVGFSQCRSCQPRDPMNQLLASFFDDDDDDTEDEPAVPIRPPTNNRPGQPITTPRPSRPQQPSRRPPSRRPRPTRKPVV